MFNSIKIYGRKLAQLREAKVGSQDRLARLTGDNGVASGTIARYEGLEIAAASQDKLRHIARAFGISYEDLLQKIGASPDARASDKRSGTGATAPRGIRSLSKLNDGKRWAKMIVAGFGVEPELADRIYRLIKKPVGEAVNEYIRSKDEAAPAAKTQQRPKGAA